MQNLERVDRLSAEIVDLLPALRAFARRFHANTNDSDDLVQETVTRALSNLDKFEEGTQLKSWLFTIMRNAFCSRFVIAKRESPGVDECIADRRTIPPSQEWAVLAKAVDQACDAMPFHYRTVLERIVIHGQSYEDAAIELGCAVGTIKSRLSRARGQILARFGSLDQS